jgi:hypothetical protein
MRNVRVYFRQKKLIFVIDLSKDLGPSMSGKTHILASSNVIRRLDWGDLRISRAAFKPKPTDGT